MKMLKLKVLMWKHLIVRVNRFIHTPIEILSTIPIFFVIFLFTKNFSPMPTGHASDPVYINTESTQLSSVDPQFIFYTPDTKVTNELMQLVGEQLQLIRRPFKLEHKLNKGYMPLKNELDIMNYSKAMKDDDALVIFQNLNGTELPKKLVYTIRMKTNFVTSSFSEQTLRSYSEFGFVYHTFMRIQWAVDSSYIKLRSGNPIEQEVSMQELPIDSTYQSGSEGAWDFVKMVLVYSCWLSLFLVFVFQMSRLLEERITGIQELIKMVGVSGKLIHISHFLNVVPTGLVFSIVGTCLLSATSECLITHTNGFWIFLFLALYFIAVISQACFCSYLNKTTQYSVPVATMVYIGFWILATQIVNRTVPGWMLPVALLVPHVPLHYFWDTVIHFESYGVDLTFNHILRAQKPGIASVLACYLGLILQTIMFLIFTWYMSHINPGPYGQAKPLNFLCQKQYWSKQRVLPEEEEGELQPVGAADARYFEPPPQHLQPAVTIHNVSKVFPKNKALSNVSLDIYKGEITVLLGHNGAGKTTLISIITGMLGATEGRVYVEGLDTVTQKEEMRRHIGLCPQHNLFFPDLTVLEHVMFFTMLKGKSFGEAKESSRALLSQLGLLDKGGFRSGQLSGGMKRRLQLACALAGDARVLVLDEPTSGLDVETRRDLWNLLLSLRGSRCVLLTTHFMEEADALGDRVAALAAGRLRCHATTLHLKRSLGNGYRLTLSTLGLPKENSITPVVISQIPDATLKEKSLNTISYNLPTEKSKHFPKLFNVLESNRSKLGIETIGVGMTTLEEVFIKLCSDVTTDFSEDNVDGGPIEPTYGRLTGPSLYFHQMCVLVRRQFRYFWSKKLSFLIMQVILPILAFILITSTTNNIQAIEDSNPKKLLALESYDGITDKKVLYNINDVGSRLKIVTDRYNDVKFQNVSDVAGAALRIRKNDVYEYNKYLVGVELNDTDAKILYTTVYRHAAPTALNLLSNIFAARMLPEVDGNTISIYNHPLENEDRVRKNPQVKESKDSGAIYIWGFLTGFIILTTLINAVTLPCAERVSGARHLHVLAGAPPALVWAAALLAHAALYTAVLAAPAVAAPAALDHDRTLDQPDLLGALFFILVLGMMAILAFYYLVSFSFGERKASIVLVAVAIIFGIFTPLTAITKDIFGKQYTNVLLMLTMELIKFTIPPHTFILTIINVLMVGSVNAKCSSGELCIHGPDGFSVGVDAFKRCCMEKVKPMCYFCFETYSPFKLVLILVGQFFIYMVLVILTEYGLFNSLGAKLMRMRYRPTAAINEDDMVKAEKAYVSKAINSPKDQIDDAMLVDDVHKSYFNILGKPCNAVKGVSFSIKKGECFGLLGVNGAGKSTLFKMLTGVECPTLGNLYANGYFIKQHYQQYLNSLAYCPQFFGLDEFLTGNENLSLLLTLQGLSPNDVKESVRSWIEIIGLQKYGGRAVSTYSGGCARRLAAGAALCAGGGACVLDEPTAGVDVAARRRLWAAVRRATAQRRAVLVSSHSMDETEALCSRIAIMSNGRVRALGSAGALRAAFARGHAVVLRLATPAADVTDSTGVGDVQRLKTKLNSKFNCTLKDEHKTMLHYHINDTMPYSELFKELEIIRLKFPSLVQDYSVSETTLEELFIAIARENRD